MNTAAIIIDAMIYVCAAAVICVGSYVVFRFLKGLVRKKEK